jgi:hypothetical protein
MGRREKEKNNSCGILMAKPEGNKLLGRTRHRYEATTKMVLDIYE